jgi:hypothetical protein
MQAHSTESVVRKDEMKARTIVTTTALAGLAVVLGTPTAPALAAKPASGNQTAQGIMVNMHGPDGRTVTVVDNKQYRFNELTASGYFTNTQSGDPTVSCNGSPTNCASDNQPATPTAPAPDPAKVNGTPQGPGAVQHNKCTFLGGGTLTGLSYQQSQTVGGLNGRGSWTFSTATAVSSGCGG